MIASLRLPLCRLLSVLALSAEVVELERRVLCWTERSAAAVAAGSETVSMAMSSGMVLEASKVLWVEGLRERKVCAGRVVWDGLDMVTGGCSEDVWSRWRMADVFCRGGVEKVVFKTSE